MNEKFKALLSVAIVPQVVNIIVEREHIDEIEALNAFYKSQTYAMLEREETKVWHYSPLTLYHVWKSEQSGNIEWPEEGLLV